MKRSEKVRRGFGRLALVGLIPGTFFAGGGVIYQIFSPTGSVFSKPEFAPITSPDLREVEYQDESAVGQLVFGPLSKRIMLRDGRRLSAYFKGTIDARVAGLVNDAIVSHELAFSQAIVSYHYYVTDGIALACEKYSNCDAPFPNAGHSHLGRKFDWTFSLISLVIGALWSGFFWIASWLIRGFMVD